MARLGPPFWPKNPPEKVYVDPPLFCVLSQEMRHNFSGGQNRAFWVGAQKVYVEQVYVLFLPPEKEVKRRLK